MSETTDFEDALAEIDAEDRRNAMLAELDDDRTGLFRGIVFGLVFILPIWGVLTWWVVR